MHCFVVFENGNYILEHQACSSDKGSVPSLNTEDANSDYASKAPIISVGKGHTGPSR